MANLNTYNFADRDIDDMAKSILEVIRAKNGVFELVDNTINYNNYDNDDFDKILQRVIVVFEYMEIKAEAENCRGPFENYNKNVEKAITIAVADFAFSDDQVYGDLTRDEVTKVDNIAQSYKEFDDIVYAGKMPRSRGNSRGNRNSNNRRSNSNRDNDAVRPHRNRDRAERDADRNSRGSRGTATTRDSNKAAPVYANPKADAAREKEEETSRRQTRSGGSSNRARSCIRGNDEEGSAVQTAARKPRAVDARKSTIVATPAPGAFKAKVFNPTTHGLYHVGIADDEAVEVVVVKDSNMEPYSAHELGASPFNDDGRNGKIVPTLDFRNMPPMGDDTAIAENADIHINNELVIAGRSFDVNVTSDIDKLISDSAYTITPIVNVFTMSLPRDVAAQLDHMHENRTFTDWKTTLDQLVKQLSSQTNKGGVLSTFITVLNKRLTNMVNALFAISVDADTRVTHFYEDFNDAYGWLSSAGQEREFTVWTDCERLMLSSGLAVDALDLTDDTLKYIPVTFRTKVLFVNGYGEVPVNSLYFSQKQQIADIEFDTTPDFYVACERVCTYRNNHLKMAQVILSDSFDNNYSILSGMNGATRIRAIQL